MANPGSLGGLGGFLQRPAVNDTVNAIFDSMISSPGRNPLANFGPAYQGMQQQRQAQQERAAWEQALIGAGIDPAMARTYAANPQAAKFQLDTMQQQQERAQQQRQMNATREFLAQNDPELAAMVDAGMPVNEAFGAYIQKRNDGGVKPTDDQREYQMAVEQGFEGSFMDYLIKMKEAGRQQVNIDTGVKLPSGFRWINPDNQDLGVEPIPGGPATQIPAELAARIGLAKDALPQLDKVIEAARKGGLSGPGDYLAGRGGFGEAGELRRELTAGAEALTRMLTGAGMNISEAQREAALYMPQPQDSAETVVNKVTQLKRRLESTMDMAGRGRGLEPAEATTGGGWTDMGGGVRIRRK